MVVLSKVEKDNIAPIRKAVDYFSQKFNSELSSNKTHWLYSGIYKRMNANNIKSIQDYISLVNNFPEEFELLRKTLLIGATSFFRDIEAFSFLQTKIIPCLLQKSSQAPFQPLRIWVAGCSTGEEAYSLAILIKESLLALQLNVPVKIFATDIDREALKKARRGLYPPTIIENVSHERLNQCFIKKEKGYCISKEIREMVVFSHHHIINDPPLTKMDLISCRNLLLYFNKRAKNKLFPILHYCLNKEGFLFLGSSEATVGFENLFKAINNKWRIYKKNQSDASFEALINFPTQFNYTDLTKKIDKINICLAFLRTAK